MARRKRATRTRRASPFRAKARTRRKSTGGSVQAIQFDAMIYGGLRGYTSDLLKPLTSKIPLGSIADELVMGVANYFIAKNTSGMIKNIALKGLTIENARLGEAIATGDLGNLLPSKSTGGSDGVFIH